MWIIKMNEFGLKGPPFSAFAEAAADDELLGACHMGNSGNLFAGKKFQAELNITLGEPCCCCDVF